MIVEKTFDLLREKYHSRFEELTISDIRVGVHLTCVRLSDGSVGSAGTVYNTEIKSDKLSRDFGDFTPTKFKGRKIPDLLTINKPSNIIQTIKIAVLNAISSAIISEGNYKIIYNKDPIDLIDLSSKKTITIVGAFQSYIHKISATDNQLYILELNSNTLTNEQKKYYIPADRYNEVIPLSDIVIITGLTLVNNTIDGLLSAISPYTKVVVTGPSSNLIPDILFQNKVNIIGAAKIFDPDTLFTIASEAGTGFHLFKYCAEKICITDE